MSTLEAEEQPSAPLLAGYRPVRGAYDEMLEVGGGLRSHWRALIGSLGAIESGELAARRESTGRMLREHGVTYNVYADAQGLDRVWSLDLLPLLISPAEWRALESGLVQRARLLNLILADVYGPQRLVSDGLLPAPLLYANPAFLRPCHGVVPPGDRFLVLHAVDLARSPDGQWWALADRTQAPSGAGYALENRMVLSRLFPDEFRDCHVQRLAGFFQSLRDTLRTLAPAKGAHPNVVLLTPGPHNETYFEQVFLARYLGFPLVEGSDLTVRDRRVFLKSVAGLQPVDVILRRLDDTFCDPLELRAESALGVPGLVEATRAGNVTLANALGSGAVEMPALMAFLPGLCRRLLDEELKLPSVATWWCGQEKEFRYVRDHVEQLVIKRAFSPASGEPAFGARLSQDQQTALLDSIAAAPFDFVAQEQVPLSTAPVWEGRRLEPRPLVMRAYVCASGDGFSVMPGALTRFSTSTDRLVVSMQSGGGSKDTWVLSDGPVAAVSLLSPPAQILRPERAATEVPSRQADNLFWLGRYAERLEDTTRILRCVLRRLEGESGAEDAPELAGLIALLVKLDLFPAKFRNRYTLAMVEREALMLIYQDHRLGAVREVLGRLRQLAFALRERFSADTWRILTQMQVEGRARNVRMPVAEARALLDRLVASLAAFSGMEMENMTRGHGWRFLDIGRRLERAMNSATLLQAALALGPNSATVLDPMLEIADSVMTYRRRYFAQPQWPTVLDLLLADEINPRSLAFQVFALADHAANLPGNRAEPGPGQPAGQVAALRALVTETDWCALADSGQGEGQGEAHLAAPLQRLTSGLRQLSDTVSQLYFSHAETRIS